MSELEKQEIFLELFEPVREKLSRYARAMTHDSDDAKDVIGDTILAAYESFERVKDHSVFASYLFTIASNILKRKHRKLRIFSAYNEELAEQIPDRSVRLENAIDIQILYKALDQLPAKQKEAVVLFEISGFSLEEIRKIQGGTLSGVKSRIKRAREQLTVLMTESQERSANSPSNAQSVNSAILSGVEV
jgi:RNA polymerase sigma-70 factor (ECF subfamily)